MNQLTDLTFRTVSDIRDKLWITRRSDIFLLEFGDLLVNAGRRIRQQHNYIRQARQSASIMANLRAPDMKSFNRLINCLRRSTEILQVESPVEGQLVFKSLGLVNNKRIASIFDNVGCDMSYLIPEEYIITLNVQDLSIVYESRNWFKKKQWIAEFSERFALEVIDSGYAVSSEISQSKVDASFSCEITALIMFWAIKAIEDEGFCQTLPHPTLRLYNNCCIFALEALISAKMPRISRLTPHLWRLCSQLCAKWIKRTFEFWSRGLIADLVKKILPSLDYMNRIMNSCPYLYLLNFKKLLDSLQIALGAAEQLSASRRCQESIFLVQYISRCIQRCKNGGDIERLNGEVSVDSNIPGIKSPVRIGRGSYGNIYRCFDLSLNSAIAIKEIKLHPSQARGTMLVQETDYLRILDHRHIVGFYGTIIGPDVLYLKMELCEGGSLLDIIESKMVIDDFVFRKFTLEILLGLSFMHFNQIFHGDLKPGNILINQFDTIKIGDLGAARYLPRSGCYKNTLNLPGTIQYMAPEVMKGEKIDFAADIWSLGCTLFHLVTGIPPWKDCETPWNIMMNVAAGRSFDQKPLKECLLDPRAIEMIESCLCFDPKGRPHSMSLLINQYLFEPVKSI